MTLHRLLFDLRPIPRIVSVLENHTEPSLRELAESIRGKARYILGATTDNDVRPSSQDDLLALHAHLKLPPREIFDVTLRVCQDLNEFIGFVCKYFSALRSEREFTDAERGVGLELRELLVALDAKLGRSGKQGLDP